MLALGAFVEVDNDKDNDDDNDDDDDDGKVSSACWFLYSFNIVNYDYCVFVPIIASFDKIYLFKFLLWLLLQPWAFSCLLLHEVDNTDEAEVQTTSLPFMKWSYLHKSAALDSI